MQLARIDVWHEVDCIAADSHSNSLGSGESSESGVESPLESAAIVLAFKSTDFNITPANPIEGTAAIKTTAIRSRLIKVRRWVIGKDDESVPLS